MFRASTAPVPSEELHFYSYIQKEIARREGNENPETAESITPVVKTTSSRYGQKQATSVRRTRRY